MASILFRLQILIHIRVILEGKRVRSVALWIVKEGLEVGVHALLVQAVLDILCILLGHPGFCLFSSTSTSVSPWNATDVKTGHIHPFCLNDDAYCLYGLVNLLHNSVWLGNNVSFWMGYTPVDIRHVFRCCKRDYALVFARVFDAGSGRRQYMADLTCERHCCRSC